MNRCERDMLDDESGRLLIEWQEHHAAFTVLMESICHMTGDYRQAMALINRGLN